MALGLFLFFCYLRIPSNAGLEDFIRVSRGTCWYQLALTNTTVTCQLMVDRFKKKKKTTLKLQLVLRKNREINVSNKLGIC